MALDEKGRRLFSGARFPAVLLVHDLDSGKEVARLEIGDDTDDLFFDAERKRLYIVCGEGRIDVFRQESPDRYVAEGSVKTAPKPLTVAGTAPLPPGMKKTASVMLLPTGVNNRDGLKVLKIVP